MSRVAEALRLLGLTEYEARAYDVVVGAGETTANTVAEAAAIPPTKVYAVLDSLETKGFVRADGRRPRRYAPERPTDLFATHRAGLDNRLDEALKVLEARYTERGTVFSGPFWLMHGPNAIIERLRLLIPAAKDTIHAFLSFPLPEVDPGLLELLARAHERGVRVRLMVPPTDPELAKSALATGAEVRFGALPIRPLMIDGRHGVVTFQVPKGPGTLEILAMWIPAAELVGQIEPAVRLIFDKAPIAKVDERR